MSATLARGQLATVDHLPPADGWRRLGLGPDDFDVGMVRRRIEARKRLLREDLTLSSGNADSYPRDAAKRVLAAATARGPTPLLAPWNGGSGFYPKDARAAITTAAPEV